MVILVNQLKDNKLDTMIAKIILREVMIVAADVSGKVSVVLALILGFIEWIGALDVNGALTTIVSILGAIYLIVKIYLGFLDAKIKRKELKE